jgi:hypothetical protein
MSIRINGSVCYYDTQSSTIVFHTRHNRIIPVCDLFQVYNSVEKRNTTVAVHFR